MITLLRWYMLKAKEIKYKLALWMFIDKVYVELTKHPDKIEQRMVDSVVRLIIGNKSVT